MKNTTTLKRMLIRNKYDLNGEWRNQGSSCNILWGSRFHCVKLASELKSADGI